tara:strand:+ start:2427 stop:2657 length:231 start_codon:yes stop_codon:yes gene_type:complete
MNILDIILDGLEEFGYNYIDYQENASWVIVQVNARSNEVEDVMNIVDTALFDATDNLYEISGTYTNGYVEIEIYKR